MPRSHSIDPHSLGATIRAVRTGRGWTLEQVELRTRGRFKASVLGAYERGDRRVSYERLTQLADVLGVPVTSLIPADPDAGASKLASLNATDAAVDMLRSIPGLADAVAAELIAHTARTRPDELVRALQTAGAGVA